MNDESGTDVKYLTLRIKGRVSAVFCYTDNYTVLLLVLRNELLHLRRCSAVCIAGKQKVGDINSCCPYPALLTPGSPHQAAAWGYALPVAVNDSL